MKTLLRMLAPKMLLGMANRNVSVSITELEEELELDDSRKQRGNLYCKMLLKYNLLPLPLNYPLGIQQKFVPFHSPPNTTICKPDQPIKQI